MNAPSGETPRDGEGGRDAPADLEAVGRQVIAHARAAGADEVSAGVYYSVYTDLAQRDGRLEKCQESRSLSVSVDLLVDGRFSSHSTNDLRPGALEEFLDQAISATRFLEPDPDRRLPDPEQMGSSDVAALEADDPSWPPASSATRRERVAELEARCLAAGQGHPVRSISAGLWDGRTDSVLVTSNGFLGRWQRTSIGYGGQVTLEDEGGRLPEAYAYYSARFEEDLPPFERLAGELIARGRRRLGSKAAPSGRYPLLLENEVVGRLLRVLIGPLSGSAIYEGRSCLQGKLGQKIGSSAFTLVDDPTVPRAAGSRPYTGDGRPAVRLPLVEDGVLRNFYLNVYNARRLGMAPTAGSSSNLVIQPGSRSPADILAGLDRAIRVEGFLGGNTNAQTGDYSFGVHGTLFERGQPVQGVSEMNVSGNLFELLDRYVEAADDVWRYGAFLSPSLLFDGIQFSGV